METRSSSRHVLSGLWPIFAAGLVVMLAGSSAVALSPVAWAILTIAFVALAALTIGADTARD